MRKKIVAGNWKMNLSYAEAMSLADALVNAVEENASPDIILASPFIYLHELISRIQGNPNFYMAAQNCSEHQKGAFTGEVSAPMLASIGIEHVLIGHSERRTLYGESDVVLRSKVDRAIESGLIPIFCCGEMLAERNAGSHFQRVADQLNNGLFGISGKQMKECIIAYEPVWAIGTGVTASSEQAQEMHAFIRSEIAKKYSAELADTISILYGGSVNAQNAAELFTCKDVDGGLVGGASLKSAEFISIIRAMESVSTN